ncbi:ABC-three component system protein [Desulfolutivibrio sp.]|uniref:ABC-three component system protein n=1 Tax=Desulfolutivibrio sp. TaxID=2773296 RepID=UPI002F961C95
MIKFISKASSKKLILFIHGFTGGEDSWVNNDSKHFGELLSSEENVDKYSVAEFVYHTKISDNTVPKSIFRRLWSHGSDPIKKTVKINEISELLKTEILVTLREYNEIIIIAHSMGGLVTKSYILKCLEEQLNHKCVLFISLAVPHKGSEIATLGNLFSSNEQISDLRPLSEYINDANKQWEECKQELLPQLVYIYGIHDSVVPKVSAAPSQPWHAVDHDHLSISKPKDIDDLIVIVVLATIAKNITELKLKKTFLLQQLDDPSKYDREDFVIKMIIADLYSATISNAKTLFYNTDIAQRTLKDDDISMQALEDLYVKIQVIYNDVYALFCGGKINDSNELLSTVYNKICEENITPLRAIADNISQHHKKGMIHHLANDKSQNIWWSLRTNYEELEGIRNAKP